MQFKNYNGGLCVYPSLEGAVLPTPNPARFVTVRGSINTSSAVTLTPNALTSVNPAKRPGYAYNSLLFLNPLFLNY
jgi:hypothetical protein